MKTLSSSLLRCWLAGVLCVSALPLSGCGSDTTDLSSDDDADAAGNIPGDDDDSANASEDAGSASPSDGDGNASGEDAGSSNPAPDAGAVDDDPANNAPDAGATEVPDPPAPDPSGPAVPDVPRESVIDDLPADDRIAVCQVYVGTATSLVATATGACGPIAVNAAVRDQTAGDFVPLCENSRTTCEQGLAMAGETIAGIDCEMPQACAATIGEFEDCQAELEVLTSSILEPVAAISVPECSAISGVQSTLLQLRVSVALASGAAASGLEFGPGGVQMSACEPLNEKCPSFAVPTNFNL